MKKIGRRDWGERKCDSGPKESQKEPTIWKMSKEKGSNQVLMTKEKSSLSVHWILKSSGEDKRNAAAKKSLRNLLHSYTYSSPGLLMSMTT